jgi:hypothetical protein
MRAKVPATLEDCLWGGIAGSVLVGLIHWKLGLVFAIFFVAPYVIIGGIRMIRGRYKKQDSKTG